MVAAIIGGGALSFLLKHGYGRPRPDLMAPMTYTITPSVCLHHHNRSNRNSYPKVAISDVRLPGIGRSPSGGKQGRGD